MHPDARRGLGKVLCGVLTILHCSWSIIRLATKSIVDVADALAATATPISVAGEVAAASEVAGIIVVVVSVAATCDRWWRHGGNRTKRLTGGGALARSAELICVVARRRKSNHLPWQVAELAKHGIGRGAIRCLVRQAFLRAVYVSLQQLLQYHKEADAAEH